MNDLRNDIAEIFGEMSNRITIPLNLYITLIRAVTAVNASDNFYNLSYQTKAEIEAARAYLDSVHNKAAADLGQWGD